MYAVMNWITSNYIGFLANLDGSTKVFESLEEAKSYVKEELEDLDQENVRIVSLKEVKE